MHHQANYEGNFHQGINNAIDTWYRHAPRTDGQQMKQRIQLITTDTMPGGEYNTSYSIRFGCAVSARAVRKLSSYNTYE